MFLNEKIKIIRESKGMSRNELGRLMKSSATHVRHIEEQQRKSISLDSFCKIAKFLDVSVYELIKGTEFDV